MKLLVIIIMLVVLYFLYRIAYPKQQKKDNEIPARTSKSVPDVMGKSRFVLPDRSKPLQASATLQGTETEAEKASNFAPETEEKRSAVIAAEQLDEVFCDELNSEIMSLPLENENEDEIDFETEEAEELHQVLGHEAILADGIDYDDLQNVVKIVKEQPGYVSEETAGTFAKLENTDMFEMLVSGDEGKINWIKSIIEQHVQNTMPEPDNENSDTMDYGDFDIADFLD